MSRFLVHRTAPITYIDRRQLLRSLQTEEVFRISQQALQDRSCTLYVGNLSYFTREAQIAAHFAPYGHIREILVGLRDQELASFSSSSSWWGTKKGSSSDPSGRTLPEPSSSSSPGCSSVVSPCGFCFVIYETRAAALAAWQALHLSLLDDRMISVGWDVGLDAPFRQPSSSTRLPSRGADVTTTTTTTTSTAAVGAETGAVAFLGVPSPSPIIPLAAGTVNIAEEVLSRRWGRGVNGGQVVDNIRQTHDEGRGGLGGLRKAAALSGMRDILLDMEATDGMGNEEGPGDGTGMSAGGSLGKGGGRKRCHSDAEAIAMLLTRAHIEEQQERGYTFDGSRAAPTNPANNSHPFWNRSAFRARCNQWNGLEGEGEDMCYYWVKAVGKRRRPGLSSSSSFSSRQRAPRSEGWSSTSRPTDWKGGSVEERSAMSKRKRHEDEEAMRPPERHRMKR